MVSVVVTAYNVGKFIKECICSILNSSYKNLELIMVEDCSSDNTLEEIMAFQDNRLRLIRNKENVGAGMSRRIGINAAKGDWVITIDGDDYIGETFLQDLVENAEKTGADIVNGGIVGFVHGMKKYGRAFTFDNKTVEGLDKYRSHLQENIRFLNNKLVRRSLYDKVEYCGRRFIEDTPTLYKLLYYANKVSYISNYGYYYRQRSHSLIHSYTMEDRERYAKLAIEDIKNFFKDKKEGKEILEMLNIK